MAFFGPGGFERVRNDLSLNARKKTHSFECKTWKLPVFVAGSSKEKRRRNWGFIADWIGRVAGLRKSELQGWLLVTTVPLAPNTKRLGIVWNCSPKKKCCQKHLLFGWVYTPKKFTASEGDGGPRVFFFLRKVQDMKKSRSQHHPLRPDFSDLFP